MNLRAIAAGLMARGIRRQALASLVLQALALVMTLVTGVVIARTLGPAEYGVWATSLAALGTLGAVAVLGLPNLITRRVADFKTREEWPRARAVIVRSWKLTGAFSVVLTVGAAAVVWLGGEAFGGSALLFAVAVAALPFMTQANVVAAVMRGLGHGVAAQAVPTLLRPAVLLVGVCVAAFLFHVKVQAILAMGLNFVAAIATLGLSVLLLRRMQPSALHQAPAGAPVDGLWKEALPFMLISVVALIGARIDLFLIAGMLDAHSAGLYEVAYRGADLVMLPLTATTAVLAPEYAKRFALRDQVSLQRLVTQSCRGLVLMSAPVAVAFMLVPEGLVTLIFGHEYLESATSMVILSAGSLLTLMMGPVHVLAGMVGHGRASATVAILAALVGATLSVALIPSFGIQGAALGRSISQVLAAMALGWWLQRRIGIRTAAFAHLSPQP